MDRRFHKTCHCKRDIVTCGSQRSDEVSDQSVCSLGNASPSFTFLAERGSFFYSRPVMDGSGGHQITLGYTRSRTLLVDFSPRKYNRKTHSDPILEAEIEQTWQSLVAQNPTLFNGSKFRFAGLCEGPGSACTLKLGLTDYKTFQGTHRSPPDPRTHFGLPSMAMPLGNVVIVETTDGYTILLVRNASVGEGKGFCVFPGGHPEPSALSPPVEPGEGVRVCLELWEGARREVLEELFLRDDQVQTIEYMTFLGIVSRRKDAKACMAFYTKVFLTSRDVLAVYRKQNVGQEETVRIIAQPISTLRQVLSNTKIEGEYVPMPELVGAAELWVQMIDLENS